MATEPINEITVSQLREVFCGSRQIGIGEEFCIVDIHQKKDEHNLKSHPFRFDGVVLIWCISGNLRISVDLNEYEIKENSMFLCLPVNIFKLHEIPSPDKDSHYVCIAMSREFASMRKVDVSRSFNTGMALMDDPSIDLTPDDVSVMVRYIDMMAYVLSTDLACAKDCVRTLCESMLCVVAGVLERRNDTGLPSSVTSRSRMLFEQFIKLVSIHHTSHRNVTFYADKLCLTPKYLSKLIKNATGKSAPEWIDSFVILDAKNMLKYSNDTIKEIVYRLNFPNQSVFYKFFKARTGMTPSEYRKS